MTSPKPEDLDITLISAKHLKNVNWRQGDLKPYAVVYLDQDRRFASKPDDFGSTHPVWNERFTLPLPDTFAAYPTVTLTLEIFHSKPSETPKPLVGSVQMPLADLIDPDQPFATVVRKLELFRPSGRPQGKARVMISLKDRPDYHLPPPSSYYYSTAPPPPQQQPSGVWDYHNYPSTPAPPPQASYSNTALPQPPPPQYRYGTDTGAPSDYYPASSYYSAPPAPARSMPAAPQPRPPVARPPYYDRTAATYGGGQGGPSAPVDYGFHEQKGSGSSKAGMGVGVGVGLAVGTVAGALGGLALAEGLKHEEGKFAEKVESDYLPRDDYYDFRHDY